MGKLEYMQIFKDFHACWAVRVSRRLALNPSRGAARPGSQFRCLASSRVAAEVDPPSAWREGRICLFSCFV